MTAGRAFVTAILERHGITFTETRGGQGPPYGLSVHYLDAADAAAKVKKEDPT